MVFREQEFVERCFCNEPAIRPCSCCGRARCDAHLAKNLCDRCTQFVGRELDKRVNRPWILGGTIGTITSLGLLVAGSISTVVLGLPLAVVTGVLYRKLDRRLTIRALGPSLAASKGELPPAPREPDYGSPANYGSHRPPGVGY